MDALSLLNVRVKPFIMVQKILISNKWYSFECCNHQRTKKTKIHGFHKNMKQQKSIFNIDDNNEE